jgi:hypothetical protein
MRNLAQYAVIAIWLVTGAYLSASGWVAMKALEETSVVSTTAAGGGHGVEYQGLIFRDEQSVMDFIGEQRSTWMWPWIFDLPHELIPLLACVGFGIVGGAARLLKILVLDRTALSARFLYGDPVFGGTIGVLVVFVAWTLPSMITTAKGPLRPESLGALALFGGLFSEHAFLWLERAAKRLFAK